MRRKNEFFHKSLLKFLVGILFLFAAASFISNRTLKLNHHQAYPFPESGVVAAVYDGDTIKVRFEDGRNKKIRLIGIDSPEIEDSRERVKFQGYMAKRFTFFHLYRKQIRLSYDWQLEDKYGRLLAYIWTEKEGLFNKFILKEGFAFAFLYFPFREDYRKEFKQAESEARKSGKGIWQIGPYPLISANEAESRIGRIVCMVFVCQELEWRKNLLFLRSSEGEFSVLIPQENILLFPELESFKEKKLSVTGFLEKYKGRLQIFVFLPCQIQVVN